MEKLKIQNAIQLVQANVQRETRNRISIISAQEWLSRPMERDLTVAS